MRTPIWIPSEERINKSNMNAFIRYVEQLTGRPVSGYNELYEWSINNIEEFWKSIWVNAGIIHSKTYTNVLTGQDMFNSKWFEGAQLNFAENLLRYRDTHIAIISAREEYQNVVLTYKELYNLTSRTVNFLKAHGVVKGDVVAGYISNTPEAVITMLATTSLGAVWTSASPDFGFQGVLDRFGQIKPKILFASEEYSYGGKIFNNFDKIKNIARAIPEIELVVLIPRYFDFINKLDINPGIHESVYISEILNYPENEIHFEHLPFDHPAYIMYSSGTTGVPKCIVHGQGGTLLQHYKELALHTDLGRHDVITYYTTCGWMMWNWVISSLMIGATIFMYEGNPVYPDPGAMWQYIQDEKISIFGTSPKYLSSIEKMNLVPKEVYDLSFLRTVLSTGAPLSEHSFRWLYDNVKNDIQLSSISGGTDIISCFMLGCPILPVYEGELQCRGLGMKVEAYNDRGEAVIEEKGDLVCTKPFPSMPVYFWDDHNDEKYYSSYFSYFPGVWRHGDFIKINKDGGVVVYGRSDATLNPGGVRIGTAEIYRIVDAMEEISESLVVGLNRNNNVQVILFIVTVNDKVLDESLIQKIKLKLKEGASPRHVPHKIIRVKDIPKTINGKKAELAVTRILNGEQIDNKDALANPESLEEYKIQTSI